MSQSSEKVLNYLTGNENIEALDAEVLQKLVAESPYFPITQLLLAKKLKSENDEQYLLQAQRTALYFSNPFWLNYQLTEDCFDEEITDEEPAITLTEDQKNHFSETPNSSIEEPIGISRSLSTNTINNDLDSNYTKEISAKIPVQSNIEETENLEVDRVVTASEIIELPDIVQVEEELSAVTRTTNEKSESLINDLDEDTETKETISESLLNIHPAADIEVIELEEEMAGVTHTIDETTDKFVEETEYLSQKEELRPDDEHDRMFQNIKAMLDASSEEASADTKNAVIPMDPYYTIDYFASQGIKLELDQNPQDQLGQHLKKFTQWLKHMKKLGPEDATEAINRTETEEDIQQIADYSNTVREVVTEAMASVLEKQGKKDKAIELYNKLSFLNHDKRAYFADKIKKLKGI